MVVLFSSWELVDPKYGDASKVLDGTHQKAAKPINSLTIVDKNWSWASLSANNLIY